MYLEQFFIDGLGCASYIIGCESQGVAAVVDPDRDVRKYLDAAAQRHLTITHIIETHLHADHVSGNTDLAQRTGADIYVHQAAQAGFPHQKLTGGDILTLGNIRLEVRFTPGHTPESISLLVTDTTRSDEPWMVLTGDTLFVGDAGRPDLVGLDAARDLAGQMYDTLQSEYLTLSDGVVVLPGHGAGSLCGKFIGSVLNSTIGFERTANPALQVKARDAYVEFAVADLPEQPGNHMRIKQINRQGPPPLGNVVPVQLTAQALHDALKSGATLLDLRSSDAYSQQHFRGALHLDLDDQLSNRAGFVLPAGAEIVLLLADTGQYESAVYSLARVGYDNVIGCVLDTPVLWDGIQWPVVSGNIQPVTAQTLQDLLRDTERRPVVVDVREAWEYMQGHIEHAQHMPLGEFAQRISELDTEQPVAVICASGGRSQSAATLLDKHGFSRIYNVTDGMNGWIRHNLPIAD